MPPDLPPGPYELRLFADNSFVPLASTTLTVTGPSADQGSPRLSHTQRLCHGLARQARPRLAALRRRARPDRSLAPGQPDDQPPPPRTP